MNRPSIRVVVDDADDSEWVSWAEAARITGLPVHVIEWWKRQGRIEHRAEDKMRPTLRRTSVDEFGVWYRERELDAVNDAGRSWRPGERPARQPAARACRLRDDTGGGRPRRESPRRHSFGVPSRSERCGSAVGGGSPSRPLRRSSANCAMRRP